MARLTERPAENKVLGIALLLLATLIFSVSDAIAKGMLAAIPPIEVSWIRSVVVVLITLPVARWRVGPAVFRPERAGRQLVRGGAVLGSSLLFLTGLSSLPLADNTAINFVYPVLVTVLSALFLGEKVGVRRWGATALGFAGMLMIVRPGSATFQSAALYPLGAALLWAIASVMTRQMTSNDAAETTILWTALVMLAGTSVILPFVWVTPSPDHLMRGVIVGICSAVAHACVVYAFEQTSAATLAPFSYLQLVWATIVGYLAFATLPDAWIAAGAALIVISGVYTAHRERVRARAAAQ